MSLCFAIGPKVHKGNVEHSRRLSNNDGCIIARSNEAKALGFSVGDPYHLNKDKLRQHEVQVFSSNYALYVDMSRWAMSTLANLALDVEIYSIDEAFPSLEGFEHRGLELCRHD